MEWAPQKHEVIVARPSNRELRSLHKENKKEFEHNKVFESQDPHYFRFLAVFSFVLFGQIILILFVKYRLEHFTERRFAHGVQRYFDPLDK